MNQQYWKLFLNVSPELEDLWSGLLFELGASGIQTTDVSEASATLCAFWETCPTEDVKSTIASQVSTFSENALCQLQGWEEAITENWQDAWKEYFQPLVVGEALWVAPPWDAEQLPEGRFPVLIDPGQGFGTGYHASTLLALQMLESHLKEHSPELMLDVGIGSGILAIAACRLGVPSVEGVDIDEPSIENANHNAALNQMSSQINAFHGSTQQLSKKYPFIIANMLQHELNLVRSDLVRSVTPEGFILCSGVLTKHLEAFIDEFSKEDLALLSTSSHEEWSGCVFQIK